MANNTWQNIRRFSLLFKPFMHPTGHVTHQASMVGAELSKTAPAAYSEELPFGENLGKREKNSE